MLWEGYDVFTVVHTAAAAELKLVRPIAYPRLGRWAQWHLKTTKYMQESIYLGGGGKLSPKRLIFPSKKKFFLKIN